MTDTPDDPASPGKESPTAPIKAYKDAHFINSPPARPLRILSEYLGPKERFDLHHIKDTVVFFGSARIRSRREAEAALKQARESGDDPAPAERMVKMSRYYEATRELAHRLTEWSMGLPDQEGRFVVASGGGPGLMEATNRGATEAGGESIGLGISLPFEQAGNPYITPDLNFEFHYFFMRKFWFAYLAKGFVVMPGGFGTLDEIMEILTLVQTHKVTKKMPIVLFGDEFWDRVVDFDALVEFGTISRKDLDLFIRTDSVDEAFDFLTEELLKYGLDKPGGGM